MHTFHSSPARFSVAVSRILLFAAIASCGGRTTNGPGPAPAAQIRVTANQSTIVPQLCPSSSCGSVAEQLEIVADLTIQETGGAAGRVDNVAMTLRRNSDNAVILNATFTPPEPLRFGANGSAAVRVAAHFDLTHGSSAFTFLLVVNAIDDGGRAVTANVSVPVQALTGPPAPRVIEVAGEYRIVQQTIVTTCGDTAAPPTVTGTVTHDPGAAPFVLRDTGGTTFNGSVAPDGGFSANAVFGPDGSGNTFTQRLEGRFSGPGFTGRLNVEVQPRNCRFERDWTATKQGSPNVIPLR